MRQRTVQSAIARNARAASGVAASVGDVVGVNAGRSPNATSARNWAASDWGPRSHRPRSGSEPAVFGAAG
ncbi:MAG: hypothetical protein QM783_19095 [Phycisphaerales bacterium]